MSTLAPARPTLWSRVGWGPIILVGGAVVVPLLVNVIFGQTTDNAAGFIQIAFASVVGHTIAIMSCLAALVYTYKSPRNRATFTLIGIASGLIIMQSLGGFTAAADALLQRLSQG